MTTQEEMTPQEERILETAHVIGRSMFEVGAREVAVMAAEGNSDITSADIEEAVERARDRLLARDPDLDWLRVPARG